MIYTVYKTTNNVNGKIYVGVHKTKDPLDSYLGSGKVMKLAIKEHGRENFTKEILFEYDNLIDAYLKESEIVNTEFVKRTDTYNLVCGGSISPDMNPLKPRKVLRGIDSPNYGKKLTEEQKENISKKLKGRKRNPEELRKFSAAMKGRTSPVKGRNLTDEDKLKKSIGAMNREKMTCIYCNKLCDPGNFSMYHGEKCKESPHFTDEMRSARSRKTSVPRNHPLRICPHCGAEGRGGNMTRSHFDNCKSQN